MSTKLRSKEYDGDDSFEMHMSEHSTPIKKGKSAANLPLNNNRKRGKKTKQNGDRFSQGAAHSPQGLNYSSGQASYGHQENANEFVITSPINQK